MYGNVETAPDKAWGPGEGCPQVPPPDEDPYEPLDPSPTAGPAPPARPSPSRRPRPPQVALVALVTLVTLVTLLLLLLGTLGARRISALEAALEAEKAKEPPPPAGSASFLLYNQHHSGCVVPSGRALSLSRCVPASPEQRWQRLPGGLLRHRGSGRCAGAAAAAEGSLVLLEPCRDPRDPRAGRQRWECGPGALLRLAGTGLHFNFGHERYGRVVLYRGQGDWSRWMVHGTQEDVCSRDCE
ncbi:hypothetical protein HGM15179_020679 [Zosterops borbonicus]|uniref:Uncharacterized protein n=1 Tax=Zosterops borbonicus TaxID=364589 RepID=A0A8K1D7B3_9PASS|nr:hypothetical protein HGM15179_020679 [Zosterops borbonicus]